MRVCGILGMGIADGKKIPYSGDCLGQPTIGGFVMKFLPGKNLAQVCKKDKVWDTHKDENVSIGALYGENPQYWRYAERMADCADWLEFAETLEHDKKLKLTRASFCHVRHCPICQWRKSLARIARFMNNLPEYLQACPDYAYIYAVFTVRNCEMSELRDTIRAENDGFKKLLKRLKRAGVTVHGFIKTVEVTKGKDGLPHPHLNAILAVDKGYFKSRAYLAKDKWVTLWRECMKLDYDPSVFVSRVRSRRKKDLASSASASSDIGASTTSLVDQDLISGFLEVSKYAVKPSDLVDDAEFLYGITEQCHKLRFISTGGCLKDIFRDSGTDGTGEADISSEEMLLQGGDDSENTTNWRQVFLWFQNRGYRSQFRFKYSKDNPDSERAFRDGLTKAIRERDEFNRSS